MVAIRLFALRFRAGDPVETDNRCSRMKFAAGLTRAAANRLCARLRSNAEMATVNDMGFEAMDRERKLIEEVERLLPEFVQACRNEKGGFILMSQDAFAPQFSDQELCLLGKAIKYAGIAGKKVRILPSKRARAS